MSGEIGPLRWTNRMTKSEVELHLPRSSVSPVGDTFTFTPCASVIGQRATGAAGGGLRMRTHGLARGKCTFSALSNCTGRPVTGPRSPFLTGATSVVMRVTIDGKSRRRDVRTRDITLVPRDERKLRKGISVYIDCKSTVSSVIIIVTFAITFPKTLRWIFGSSLFFF